MLAFYMSVITEPEQKQTFGEIYADSKNALFRAAMGVLHNEHDAEDAVQEAFMYIAKNINKIGALAEAERRSLVVIIARNAAIDIYRKNRKESERTAPLTDIEAAVDVDYFEDFDYRELRNAISELSPKYKDIIYLRYVKEMSVRKTAKILNISADTVYKRIERAKLLLKEKLHERGGEYEEQ